MNRSFILAFLLVLVSVGFVPQLALGDPLPKHQLPTANDGSLVIGSCDGKSAVTVQGKKTGEKLTEQEAQTAANQLMEQWTKSHPGQTWTIAQATAAPDKEKGPSFRKPVKSDVATAVANKQKSETQKEVTKQSGTYSDYSTTEKEIWVIEQDKLVKLGDEIFHSSEKLGGTTGMACAMCHPNGSNTHPETYPKFQVQLQRVAMLRDMINWCLENPIKAPLLKDDDPKMHALEAYIMSTRKGVAMSPGKH